MTRCQLGCLHRELVADYRDARAADELRAENVSNGHESERRSHLREHGVTFRDYLEGSAGRSAGRYSDAAESRIFPARRIDPPAA